MAKWEEIFGKTRLIQISFEKDTASDTATHWGVDKSNDIWRRHGEGAWKHMPGSLKQVSVGAWPDLDFAPVWGVTDSNTIKRWEDERWTSIPGILLKQVSVGAAGVWGVNSANQIFRWNDNTRHFEQIGGSLKMVASGKDSVWGINPAHEIYRWSGGSGADDSWERIGGSLVQIDAGSVACGVNDKGKVLRWRGGDETGNLWEKLGTEAGFKYASIAENGSILAIDAVDKMWVWR